MDEKTLFDLFSHIEFVINIGKSIVVWILNHGYLILKIIICIVLLFCLYEVYIRIKDFIIDLIEKYKKRKKNELLKIARQTKSKVKGNKRKQTVKIAKKCKSNKRVKMQILAKPTITDIKTEMPTVEAKPTKGIYVIVDDCFYRESEITLNDVHYLISKDCVKEKFYSINTKKTESFLLKPRHNESVSHFFVIRDIVDYLTKSKAEHIVINATQNPDIAFTRFGKKYGIEVETGKMLKSGKMRIIEKVKDMNKKFDDWFFVVTDKNLKKKYIQFADTVDKRGIAKRLTKMRVFVR
jgi:ribosomal protein L44E